MSILKPADEPSSDPNGKTPVEEHALVLRQTTQKEYREPEDETTARLNQANPETAILARQLMEKGFIFACDNKEEMHAWEASLGGRIFTEKERSARVNFSMVFKCPAFEKRGVFMELKIVERRGEYIVEDILWYEKEVPRIQQGGNIDMKEYLDGVYRAEGVMQRHRLPRRGRYLKSTYETTDEVIKHCLRSVEYQIQSYIEEDRLVAERVEFEQIDTNLKTVISSGESKQFEDFLTGLRGASLGVVIALARSNKLKKSYSQAIWALADEMAQKESPENVYDAIVSFMRGRKRFAKKASNTHFAENHQWDADCYIGIDNAGEMVKGLKDLRFDDGKWKAIFIEYQDLTPLSPKREMRREEIGPFDSLKKLLAEIEWKPDNSFEGVF